MTAVCSNSLFSGRVSPAGLALMDLSRGQSKQPHDLLSDICTLPYHIRGNPLLSLLNFDTTPYVLVYWVPSVSLLFIRTSVNCCTCRKLHKLKCSFLKQHGVRVPSLTIFSTANESFLVWSSRDNFIWGHCAWVHVVRNRVEIAIIVIFMNDTRNEVILHYGRKSGGDQYEERASIASSVY
jgi:hypothetical protein